jgi:hypothetical protein
MYSIPILNVKFILVAFIDSEGIMRKLFPPVIIVPFSLFPNEYPPDKDVENMKLNLSCRSVKLKSLNIPA